MPTRRQLIQKITLNADASSVTFSNIPQNYTDLKLVVSARSSFPLGALGGYFMEFNDSSGGSAGYTTRMLSGTSEGVATTTYSTNVNYPGSFLRYIPADTATANTFSSIESYIPNYSSSNSKSYITKNISENNSISAQTSIIGSLWNNNSAITKIKLWVGQPDNAAPNNYSNFKANSTFYLYGITQVPIIRGGEVSVSGGFKIHTFRNTSTLQVVEPGNVEYLIVGGGGGGGTGGAGCGGGGAGGYLSGAAFVTAQVHTVTVGGGGAGPDNTGVGNAIRGSAGSNSSAFGITANGGGGGGAELLGALTGGGSGGGGYYGASGAAGTSGQGNAGGNGSNSSPSFPGGGGGGAGATGGNASAGQGGNGGAGSTSSISGSSVTYAGGGGGSTRSGTAGSGGSGGGGAGTSGTTAINATNGIVNLGGGGGACANQGNAGDGGSGIVIIRYPYDGN